MATCMVKSRQPVVQTQVIQTNAPAAWRPNPPGIPWVRNELWTLPDPLSGKMSEHELLDAYVDTYRWQEVMGGDIVGGTNNKVAFTMFTPDGGKHWYVTEAESNGFAIVGLVEKLYPPHSMNGSRPGDKVVIGTSDEEGLIASRRLLEAVERATNKGQTAAAEPPAPPPQPAIATAKIWKVEFNLRAPNASTVYLTGDFNNWSETATPMLKRTDGDWAVGMELKTGAYKYKFLVDGQWMPDPTTPSELDRLFRDRHPLENYSAWPSPRFAANCVHVLQPTTPLSGRQERPSARHLDAAHPPDNDARLQDRRGVFRDLLRPRCVRRPPGGDRRLLFLRRHHRMQDRSGHDHPVGQSDI